MAAITSALVAIVGVVLGWIAIEIACKPCLESGREAIDRSLNPDYDPDDEAVSVDIRAPLNPPDPDNVSATSSDAIKTKTLRWDDVEANRHSRVSPWEIERAGSVASSNSLITSGLKRTRVGLPSGKPEFPVPGKGGIKSATVVCFMLLEHTEEHTHLHHLVGVVSWGRISEA
ncbi:hypothetical protein LWI28_009087 [Acer negundo]|uniref:Uncharacterized protein n=1 Tax=Acer negundo TaxID=4023 RepID=A0AAD5JGB7_ACENE|nr:hypothetical protein LWI28_009087 [Acer negundo]